MERYCKAFVLILFLFLMVYILPPSPEFPMPLPDSLQSKEMGDTETPLRRAYFTNLTREEVIQHYRGQFSKLSVLNVAIPVIRLNYPPEESQTLIRDQTKSTFLEELVHPLRESMYINGYEPKEAQHAINIEGKPWRQKIIIRYAPSHVLVRVAVVSLASVICYLLLCEWLSFFKHD